MAGSSNVFAFGAGGTGGAAFSLAASTSSTISEALIVNSGTYLPFAGQVTMGGVRRCRV